MDSYIEDLIRKLPKPELELTEKNIKKIHEYMPVPNDHIIMWAEINSFRNFPSGIVLTNKGIVYKAPRPEVKGKSKKEKKEIIYNAPYQIVLWEYFDPDDFEIVKASKDNCFTIRKDGKVLSVFTESALKDFFNSYSKKLRADEDIVNNIVDSAYVSELENLNMESAMFNAAYGEDQSKTGHGIYAEEAGAMMDRLSGEKSTVTGRDNAKNGPDKIVNGNPVQCKFYKSAGSSVGACFKTNPTTGKKEYRYFDIKTGSPMQVEVPADQYEKAVEAMKARIEAGQIPGVNDPEKAKELVRKSKLTYSQAKNLAKAGTFESITYDTVTGAINCTFAAGISSLFSFGLTYWRTDDPKKAREAAIDAAIGVFGPALAANILTNQIARTGLTKALVPASDKIVKKLGSKTVQKLVNARRALLGKGKIYGGAANKSLAKALRSTGVVEGVSFVVFSVPDTYRVSTNRISGAQYTKNVLSSVASIAGSIASTYGAGSVVGKIGEKIGKNIDKKIGAAIGFVAGAGGGMIAGYTVKKITDLFKEDDAMITARLFNVVVVNMAVDYFMDEAEIKALISELDKNSRKINAFQRKIRILKYQYQDIEEFLRPYFEKATEKRKRITCDIENKAFKFDEMEAV